MNKHEGFGSLGRNFPWLGQVPLARREELGVGGDEADVADLSPEELTSCARSLAELAVTYLPGVPLVELFPCHGATRPVSVVPLSARASNVLTRHGCVVVGDVLALSARDIMDLRNSGAGTVFAVVVALAEEALRDAAGSGLNPAVDPPRGQPDEADPAEPEIRVWGSPDLVAFVTELRELALVLAGLGRPGESPIDGFAQEMRSTIVNELLERILGHTAADLFPGDVREGLVADLLSARLTTEDDKESAVLIDRVFANEPAKLDEIARRFGVTRERIRQIEAKVKTRLRDGIEMVPLISHIAEVVRESSTHVVPLDVLLETLPALREEVRAVGQPVWRVLDRLDESYEVLDGWVAQPTVAAAVAKFRGELASLAGRHQLVPVSDIRAMWPEQWITQRRSHMRRWLDYCGLPTLEGFVLVGRDGMLERAVAVLAAEAEPLTAEAIHDRIALDRSIRSLKNQLSDDDRFVRVGRNAWGLAEWGMTSYTSIRGAIREYLESKNGSADLSELADTVSETFGVRRQSVIAYAMAHPFESRNGVVRMAEAPRAATKGPSESRRVYRRGEDWLYRLMITHEHVRGSGSLMPPGLCQVLELVAGGSLELDGPAGPQAFYWTGMQPTFGSVKGALEALGVREGEEVFFVITGKGKFQIERRRPDDGSDRDALLASLGQGPALENADLLSVVAASIGAPGQPTRMGLASWLGKRGEADLLLLLDAALATAQ